MKYNRSIQYALISHSLEKYDVFLYGFLMPIISPLFIPKDASLATYFAFVTFASGYLIRPLGAIVFGHLGDKKGRKRAFMWTMMLVIIPTFVIAFLPTYTTIGMLAPLALLLCRLLQGFSAGSEFSGAIVFVLEHAKNNNVGLTSSLVRAVGFFGVAFGTLIGSLATLEIMPNWSWRIPILFGAIVSLIAYLMRKKMEETPEFVALEQSQEIAKIPLIEVFKYSKKAMLCGFGIMTCSYIFLYFTTVYIGSLYNTQLGFSASQTMIINTVLLIFWGIINLLSGKHADQIGLKKYLSFLCYITLLIIIPIYFWLDINNFYHLIGLQIFLTLVGASFLGPAAGLFKNLFPTRYRYSGVAFTCTLAQATLGSTTPIYAKSIVTITHYFNSSVLLIILGAIFGLLGLWFIKTEKTLKIYPMQQTTYG